MDDDHPTPQGSGVSPIAGEARRWQAQQRRERTVAAATRRRDEAAAWAGYVLYLVGPVVAVPLSGWLTGGLLLVIPITIASCGVAGLLWADPGSGIAGPILVLFLSLSQAAILAIVAFIIAAGFEAFAAGGETEAALVLTLIVLIMVASAEAGYLAGRPVARRKRSRASTAHDDATTEITLDIHENDGRRYQGRFYGRTLAENRLGDIAYLTEDGRVLYHFRGGELLALADEDLDPAPDWMDSEMRLDIMAAIGDEAVIDTREVAPR